MVTDNPPARLGNVQWLCTPSAGASCTASGSGPIAESVNMAEGEGVTYILTGDLLDSDETPITNTASATAPAGVQELNGADNSDSDTDLIGLFADSVESVEPD